MTSDPYIIGISIMVGCLCIAKAITKHGEDR